MSYWLPMWLPFFLNPTNQFKGVALAPDAVAKIDELLTRFLIGIQVNMFKIHFIKSNKTIFLG